MTITRRDMLKRAARAAGVFCGCGALLTGAHVLLRKRPLQPAAPDRREALSSLVCIRPPGAIDEARFLAACIRCYRCQDACPCGAIRFFTEKDGRAYHTPYVDPAVKACILCMKCTQACPTSALDKLRPEEKDKVHMATVSLREDLCLSHKAKRIRDEQAMMIRLGMAPTRSEAPAERRGPCGECYMFCPLRGRAIQLKGGAFLAPVVFTNQCVGCGMCEEICRVMVRGEPAIRVAATRKMLA